ncbi:universal stress protein UspA [Bacterioplanes sanyensis]|uniref:Universal stress protein UspA n=1 Tax=Bacterioplanes sanyensis TaxID=1249553 RepID=A0A222FJF2_9GAMM|nr:universal stress protein [Bacterioplanes sanyensis]ASP39128.1 universal stress protein UspA [Bacterioplanes sanyensis]
MNHIVACIDGSSVSPQVCQAAAWVSQRLQAPLRLLHVLERDSSHQDNLSGSIGLGAREHLLRQLTELDEQRARLALEHGKHILEDAHTLAKQHGADTIETLQRHGTVVETLLEQQEDTRVLVMGRQGEAHASLDHALGSHLEAVVRGCERPLLVTVGDFSAPKRFMVAFDGSDTAQKALDAYSQSPLLQGLPCHLVMVGHDDDAHQQLLDKAAAQLQSHGFEVTVAKLQGEVQPALSQYQQDHNIDLMVMGAYGHSRIRQFFVGSHTRKMVSQSDVPLLLLR